MGSGHREQLAIFLADVRARPHEDLPRLVLGDWLQDHGDPRGELISVQVQRSHLPEGDPLAQRLLLRERQLLGRHALDWLGPLADLATTWQFTRGFLRVEARAERLLPAAEGLAEREALAFVEEVRLRNVLPNHLTVLAGSPLLDHLPALDLADNRLGDRGIGRLLGSPRLCGLRRLSLRGNHLGAESATLLALCPEFGQLRVLDLARNRIGDEGARALAESPHLANLVELDVRGNDINFEGISLLRGWLGGGVLLGRRPGLAED